VTIDAKILRLNAKDMHSNGGQNLKGWHIIGIVVILLIFVNSTGFFGKMAAIAGIPTINDDISIVINNKEISYDFIQFPCIDGDATEWKRITIEPNWKFVVLDVQLGNGRNDDIQLTAMTLEDQEGTRFGAYTPECTGMTKTKMKYDNEKLVDNYNSLKILVPPKETWFNTIIFKLPASSTPTKFNYYITYPGGKSQGSLSII